MNLNDREWKDFPLSQLGKISSGKDVYADERISGNRPYITSGSQNNGIGYFVGNTNKTIDKGYISINRNGAVGKAFFHPYESIMGNDCRKLHLFNKDGNVYICQFISLMISSQQICFSYSRKLGTARANKMKIMLPVNKNGNPDYDFMEQYVKELTCTKSDVYISFCKHQLKALGVPKQNTPLHQTKWKPFYIKSIFDTPQRGKRIVDKNHIAGNTPLVSSYGQGNGVTHFIGNEDKVRKFTNCLSIANGGSSAGKTFFHPYTFIAADHVTQCWNTELNEYQYLFLATVMTKALTGKYSFSHEISDPRLAKERIMLPATDSGEPDYLYMEQYVKNMMIAKYQSYLDYVNR